MFAGLIGWLASKPVIGAILSPIISGLLTAQKQKLDAAGSHEARVSELAGRELDLDKREAEVNAQVIVAEQGNWVTRSVRPMMALPVIIVLWKILVWDTAFHEWTHGETEIKAVAVWGLIHAIVWSYMGGRSGEKIADKIAGIFKK